MVHSTHQPPLSGAQFDHIGLVVRSLDKGRQVMRLVHGVTQWTLAVTDAVNGVHLLFGRDPCGVVYELLEPVDTLSPVYGALKARKNLLNHVAYRVADLPSAALAMRAAGCAPIGEPKPAIAFNNCPIQFFATPLNTVIELIEAPTHVHVFTS